MRDLVHHVHWQWVPVVLVIGFGIWLRDGAVVALTPWYQVQRVAAHVFRASS